MAPRHPTTSQDQARWSKERSGDAGAVPVGDLERQLAEHRAATDRLSHERDVLLARVTELERDQTRRGERYGQEAADLRVTLAKAEEQAAAARHRVAVLEELVADLSARSGGGPAAAREAAAVLPAPAPTPHRRRRRLALAAAALLAVGGAAAAGAAIGGEDGGEPTRAAPRPAPVEQPPAVKTLAPCSEVPAPGPGKRVTCTTGRTLVIAAGNASVVLRDLEARVLKATRTADTAEIRLRIRAETDGPQTIGAQQVVLGLDGERLLGTGIGPPVQLRPGITETVGLRFALTPEVRSALERSDNRADLAIAPFSSDGEAARWLGVVRLTLGRAG